MNKLTLGGNGGHPLSVDDIMFVHDSLLDVVTQIAKDMNISSTVTVLSGCVITELAGNFTYTAGYVLMNDEIFFVPAQPVPAAIPVSYYVDIVETNITKTYKNASTPIVRKIRTAKIVGTLTTNALTSYGWRLDEAYRLVGTPANPAYNTTWGGSAGYRRIRHKEVQLSGIASIANMNNSDRVMFTLNALEKPARDHYFTVYGNSAGTLQALLIKIDSASGDVSVQGGATGAAKDVYLDSIRFFLD